MGKPAARVGDTTAHGGTIVGPGCPTVLIGKMPAAVLGDNHVCPMQTPATPPIPHVGGPIMPPCSTGVFIGGKPAARVGDMAMCTGPPDSIVMGCMTVMIGEMSPGGGGGGGGGQSASGSLAQAEAEATETEEGHFLDVSFEDDAGFPVMGVPMRIESPDGTVTESALAGRVRQDNVPDGTHTISLRAITSAQWSTRQARVGDTVTLTAETVGIDSGAAATLEIYVRDPGFGVQLFHTIETEVQSDKIESEWEFEVNDELLGTQDDRIPRGYSSPSFYFVARAGGLQQRSSMLNFTDTLEIVLEDEHGDAIPNQPYRLLMPNGEVREGTVDGSGRATEENVPPGRVRIEFTGENNSSG